MGEGGYRPVHGPVDQRLARGVAEVLLAADDVGHAHVVVVRGHGQIVGGIAVGPQQDQVVQVLVGKTDRAAHQVLDHRLPLQRRLEAHHIRLTVLLRAGAPVAPGRVEGVALLAGHRLQGLGLLGREVAAERPAPLDQLVNHRSVDVGAGELEDRRGLKIQAQPRQTVEDHLHRRLRGALAVCVLDAQPEASAAVTRIKPVEQRGPGVANVHGAGWRGGGPGDDGGHWVF